VLQSQSVAALLIPTVASITVMPMDQGIRQGCGQRYGLIAAAVVNHNDEVHNLLSHHLIVGFLQGGLRIISGHHNDYFLVLENRLFSSMRLNKVKLQAL
jgi:hypothetical protein